MKKSDVTVDHRKDFGFAVLFLRTLRTQQTPQLVERLVHEDGTLTLSLVDLETLLFVQTLLLRQLHGF